MSNAEENRETSSKTLSAEQLIQQGWHRDSSLPVRGVKEYAPDGTWIQDKMLEVTFKDRTSLLQEERVAKLGSLARGEWTPDVKRVHLVRNKKKFWQTMGHSEDGVDYLYPEEALFLLDAGMMEIYYEKVPLSLQKAYTTLLDSDLTLEQYQVFAFLSRYGFILRRHNPNVILTEYERQLRLDQYCKVTSKKKKKKKLKRGANGELDETQQIENQGKRIKVDGEVQEEGSNSPAEKDPSCAGAGRVDGEECAVRGRSEALDSPPVVDEDRGQNDRAPEVFDQDREGDGGLNSDKRLQQNKTCAPKDASPPSLMDTRQQDEPRTSSRLPYTQWDWSKVTLPDIANKSHITVLKPSMDLLPCCVLYSQEAYSFDVASFRRGQRTEASWEYSLGGTSWKRNIRAANWEEYRAEYRKHVEEYSLETSPAGHLWRGDVVPLVKPQDATSTASIQQKLQIIESVQLSLPQHTQYMNMEKTIGNFRVLFDVYQPNSKFKKTGEMFPHHHLCVVKSSDRLPSLGETLLLHRTCLPRVPLHFAVVDAGDINFYSFHDIKLPTDST